VLLLLDPSVSLHAIDPCIMRLAFFCFLSSRCRLSFLLLLLLVLFCVAGGRLCLLLTCDPEHEGHENVSSGQSQPFQKG
jgi:hypothetical protein